MTQLTSIPEESVAKIHSINIEVAQPKTFKNYIQINTLADIATGRIRRRGMPFRRPFSL